ncbi:MAG: hypothetical protein U0840_02900 [Gemmataceae bacterium]
MKLDLRRDFADLSAHLAERVRDFDPTTNNGPGEPGPVRMIQVGFEYAQGAWVAIVFDTRPDAEPDGEWNSHIEGNAFERPHWLEAGEANLEGPITLVHLDGTEIELEEGAELAEPLGEMIRAVLLQARANGLFASLPKAPGCELAIEHQDGAYGWPPYEERGQENLA